MTIALVFGISFYLNSVFPQNFDAYFKPKYYGQFGPIAICVELFIAGIYLYKGDKKVISLLPFSLLLPCWTPYLIWQDSLVPTFLFMQLSFLWSALFGLCIWHFPILTILDGFPYWRSSEVLFWGSSLSFLSIISSNFGKMIYSLDK